MAAMELDRMAQRRECGSWRITPPWPLIASVWLIGCTHFLKQLLLHRELHT